MIQPLTTDTAVYYPNRIPMHDIKILGKTLKATNNYGAACHENRNFIDKNALLSLNGGQNLFENRVPPIPPCSFLAGFNMPQQQVLGMIAEQIRATWEDRSGQKLIFMLDNILIIDKLPVPLHLNIKRNLFVGSDPNIDVLFGNFVSFTFPQYKFNKKILPVQYHNHPFWTEDDENVCIGLERNHASLSKELKDAKDHFADSIAVKCCAHCQITTGNLKKCGACLQVAYCSVEHQKLDWRTHKMACRAVAGRQS